MILSHSSLFTQKLNSLSLYLYIKKGCTKTVQPINVVILTIPCSTTYQKNRGINNNPSIVYGSVVRYSRCIPVIGFVG